MNYPDDIRGLGFNLVQSRRAFIRNTSILISTSLLGVKSFNGFSAEYVMPPIAVFSKIYQALNLNFEEAAELTATAGLDGVDCPVRSKGEIEPAEAEEKMPQYVEALKKRGLKMLLLTTDITSVKTPFVEKILRTAKKLGIKYYRLGFRYKDNTRAREQLAQVKAELKELAQMNREIGICAIFQNHSPAGREYFGGNIDELREAVAELNPNEVGIAFDLAHAIIVHGDEWRAKFESIKSHFKVAYIKDVKRPRAFVPFGQGEFGSTEYFKLLKQMGYKEPFSLHIEFDYAGKGNPRTKEALRKTLTESKNVLIKWMKEA